MNAREHAQSVRALVHEFNNLLFIIGGHSEMLSQQLPPTAQAQSDLSAINDATDRASTLTAELRALAMAHAASAGDAGDDTAHADVSAR